MLHRLMKLTDIKSLDADVQRRGRLVAFLILIMLTPMPLIFLLLLTTPQPTLALLVFAITLCFAFIALWLIRMGYVTGASALILIVTSLAILVAIPLNREGVILALFFLVLPILMASLILPPIQIWIVTSILLTGLTIVLFQLPAELVSDSHVRFTIGGIYPLLLMITLIGFLGARVTNTALREAQIARHEAEQARAILEHMNVDLETRVAERTAELSTVLTKQRAMTADLQESIAAQQELSQLVAELSLPIIPVRDDVLVVPLIGNLNSDRAEQLLTNVLEQIETHNARTVIIDITGVSIVDSHVAMALLRTATATRFMGAETILVGIRPEVAQSLVNLGVDLANIHAAATLQEALAQLRRSPIAHYEPFLEDGYDATLVHEYT